MSDSDDDIPRLGSTASLAAAFKDFQDHADRREMDIEAEAAAGLIRYLKLGAADRQAVYEIAASEGRDRPLLRDIVDGVPDLPIYPVADRQKNFRDNAGLSQFFPIKKANALPFVKRYVELYQDTAADRMNRPLVLFIKWPHLTIPVCVHTMKTSDEVPGVRFVMHAQPKKGGKFIMTVEPVSQLLALLQDYGWNR